MGLDLAEGARRIYSGHDITQCSMPFSSYTRDQNLGVLGAEQAGRHCPRVLDVAVSNPSGNIYAQVLGIAPV